MCFLFPISDSWSKPSKSLLRHYDGLGKELGLPELSHLADELLKKAILTILSLIVNYKSSTLLVEKFSRQMQTIR
jgi:hypothetical protein